MVEVGILKANDKVELIHGEILEMSPVGSKHASVVKRLAKRLTLLFGDEAIIGIQDPVLLEGDSEPEPDISILKPQDDYYESSHPMAKDIWAIIEVADSTLTYDTSDKLELYAQNGIALYWVIELPTKRIAVFSDPENGDYQTKQEWREGETAPILGRELDLSGLFPKD